MCGICGFIDFAGTCPDPREVVRRMTDLLRHRGPDDEGYLVEPACGLYAGMRRLAVIDLVTGRQPIGNETGVVQTIQNGEIYNFPELKRGLIERGHRYRTNCDTEAIVHLYEEKGEDFVRALDGMFAIALFDRERNRLILARDRMGVKPLFYTLDDRRLVFASEIKSILAYPGVERRVEPRALIDFLTLNYVVAPTTLFAGVRQLLPGEMLVIDLESKTHRFKRYWEIDPRPDERITEEEAVAECGRLLRDAIRRRLISDVPLGAFLSGGIDSSAIVALMAEEITSKPLKTFSVGFDEATFNELHWAREVSRLHGTENHEIVLDASALEVMPYLVWCSEEPTADSSILPAYYVSKIARDEVTVILSGDGADEIFSGYETYKMPEWLALWKRIPGAIRRPLGRLIEALPERTRKLSPEMLLKRFVRAANRTPEEAHFMWRMICYEEDRRALVAPDFFAAHRLGDYDPYDHCRPYFERTEGLDQLTRMQYADAGYYLPNDMIPRLDRSTMAVSLEAREPFLDHHLVQYLFRVPAAVRFRGRVKKHLLKKFLRGKLPDALLDRKKQGFNVPIGHWFRNVKHERLREIFRDLGGRLPFMNATAMEQVLDDHIAGRRDNGFKLWGLLTLILWHETFVGRTDHGSPLTTAL